MKLTSIPFMITWKLEVTYEYDDTVEVEAVEPKPTDWFYNHQTLLDQQ